MLYNSTDGDSSYPVDSNRLNLLGIKPLSDERNDQPAAKKLSATHLSKMATTKTTNVKKTNRNNDNSVDIVASTNTNTPVVASAVASVASVPSTSTASTASIVTPTVATITPTVTPTVTPTITSTVIPLSKSASSTLNGSTVGSLNGSLNGSSNKTTGPSKSISGSGLNNLLVNTKSGTTSQSNSLSTTTTNKVIPGQSLTPNNPSNTEHFADLTYTEVQINLRILGDLKEGEKIMITDDKNYMQVDNRYMQGVRRHITSDSRIRTLKFIAHVIDSAKNYCNEAVHKININEQKQINLQMLINIQRLLGNALTGLSRLATTYGDDKLNLAMIDTYKSTITVFCDQDLKRAISVDENSA